MNHPDGLDRRLLDQLRDAEHHVAAAEWRVTCQLESIEQMRRKGGGVQEAEAVLDALTRGLVAWDARRLELLDRLPALTSLSVAA